MKIHPVGAELFREDRRTDRHDEATTKASEKAICFETLTTVVDQIMVFFRVSEPCSRQTLLPNRQNTRIPTEQKP
jgi:hypothetical protein